MPPFSARTARRVAADVFAALRPGDIVFFDGPHRAFMNSDAVVFCLEVLPSLQDAVLVGMHDILLPCDYPPHWAERCYFEQYPPACHLLAEDHRAAPLLLCHSVSLDERLSAILDPLWRDQRFRGLNMPAYAFWLTTGGSEGVDPRPIDAAA